MSGKKNPLTTAIVERAGNEETAALQGTANSCSYSNMKQGRPQGPISRFLICGQENAVPLQQLVKLSGHDNRTTRKLIEIERRMGTPICSDNQTGYYLAADAGELERFVRSMMHRASEIWKTARSLDESLRQTSGQEWMEGF